jgi:hypothetical protein
MVVKKAYRHAGVCISLVPSLSADENLWQAAKESGVCIENKKTPLVLFSIQINEKLVHT